MYESFTKGHEPPKDQTERDILLGQMLQIAEQHQQATSVRSVPKSLPTREHRPRVSVSWPVVLCVALAVWFGFFGGWDMLTSVLTPSTTTTVVYQTATAGTTVGSKVAPTLGVIVPPDVPRQPIVPVPAVQPANSNIAANEATSQAMYQATVAAAEVPRSTPIPGTLNVGVSYGGLQGSAGEIVPTSLPMPTPYANNAQGQQSARPINVQATHTCFHGQTWIEGLGCRNPRLP